MNAIRAGIRESFSGKAMRVLSQKVVVAGTVTGLL